MVFNYFTKFLAKNSYRLLFQRKSHIEVATVSNEVYGNKSEKTPFMKNIFLGKVDADMLYFPEVEQSEEKDTLVEPKPLQLETKAIVEEETTFSRLLKSGVCGMGLPQIFGGFPSNSSSFLREMEKLDIPPITSFLLETQYSLIIENILKYGSDLQKQKYLKDLVSGAVIGAYALHEEKAGSDPPSIECTATPLEYSDDSSYLLTGEKTWISNANIAKFFIVFAQYIETNKLSGNKVLSAFIVDKDIPGIIIKKEKNVLEECDICRVKFDNVVLEHNSMLGSVGSGYNIATSNLESSKFIFASSVLNLLRHLISQVSVKVSQTSRFPTSLKDYEIIQYRISKVAAILYALESSVYFLAGIKDLYIMDTSLESVIVQNLIYSYGLSALYECFNLAGIKAHVDANFSKSELEALQLLIRSFTIPEIYKLYISLKGLEFVGEALSETVKKVRNPFNFPGFIFKRIFYTRMHAIDSPTLKQKLFMHYHPTLKVNADQLEYCIYRLQYCLENLLINYGTESVHRQIDLFRISNIATDIFSMIAVLARASRSYCTGIRHHDEEIWIANAWCQDATKRIKINVSDIVGAKINLADHAFIKLAPHIFQNKGYFFTNPMEKNIN